MASLLAKYSNLLARNPIQMAIISTGTLSFIGDVLSQRIEDRFTDSSNKKFKWDMQRSIRFGFVGMILVGPSLAIWYSTLGRLIPGDSFSVAMKRMVLDQSFFSLSMIS